MLTCHACLRSFSVLARDGVIGIEAIAKCFHCGVEVPYHIADSVLPIKDDLTEFVRYSTERVASMRAMVQRSKQMRETSVQMQRSVRKRKDERNARGRKNRVGTGRAR